MSLHVTGKTLEFLSTDLRIVFSPLKHYRQVERLILLCSNSGDRLRGRGVLLRGVVVAIEIKSVTEYNGAPELKGSLSL